MKKIVFILACIQMGTSNAPENTAKQFICQLQGLLDEQFVQLEELQDDANPNFVEEVVTLFYRDSARLILNIDQAL